MSAEALRAVMKHSTACGPELLVQLAIAHLSDSRNGYYPKATAKYEDIAAAARMSVEHMRHILKRLVSSGRLSIVEKPHGQTPGTYELPIRGWSNRNGQGWSDSATLIREDPYTQNSCAGSTAEGDTSAAPSQPSNIVLYPTKKKLRKGIA